YYPRNINRTRCCDKPMCTECFVQLKRLESAPTESPACPYCVEPHFGVIYSSALLPAGFASSNASSTTGGTSMSVSSSSNSLERGCSQSPHSGDSSNPSSPSGRRRSTSHKSPEVVSADDLRPDWNRRILAAAQRQPGSRRASMSSSVSGATFALGRRLAASRQGSSSRRSNSSTAAADYSGYLTAMRHMGTDLEELMIMEAVRQSLQDEQDRLAREATGAQSAQSPPAGSQPLATSSSLTTVGQGTTAAATTAMTGVLTNPLSVTDSSQESTSRGGDSQTSDSEVDEESSDSSDEEAPGLLENQAIRYAAAAVHGTGPLACLVPSTAQIPLDGTAPKHRAEGQRATEL
ncbi:SNF1-interacting protein, partial [Lunasporangiospora selenospora]